MITQDLYSRILLPPSARCDRLLIVSGYVTGALARTHLVGDGGGGIAKLAEGIQLDVAYGMYSIDGVDPSDHKILGEVAKARERFNIRYAESRPPIHSKVYVWLEGEEPVRAYLGSANYSVNAFMGRTWEAMTEVSPADAYKYANEVFTRSTPAFSIAAPYFRRRILRAEAGAEERELILDRLAQYESVRLTLTTQKGDTVPERSGLNWGQRNGRDRNQAYIAVPRKVAVKGFFPPRGAFFTVETDDGQVKQCVVAQEGDKAIHTPGNNAELGLYFRTRLGLPSGAFVELNHLERYGRTDVDFYKLGEDKYFLDFSVK